MAVHRLDNDRWGFESSCFVCEPRNHRGLQIPFFHDDVADLVYAEFALDAAFSGAPSYVHGGITLAVLDEGVAWAAIAVGGKFAVTHTTSTTFERPVRVDRTYRVEARVVDQADDRVRAEAQVLDHRATVRARTEAELAVLGPVQAADAIGREVVGRDSDYLR